MSHICLLRLGGEGGGLELVLEMTQSGIFSFAIQTSSDKWLLLEDEEDSDFSSYNKKQPAVDFRQATIPPLVIDWQGGLRLLDETGWAWPLLSPIFIHPCISGLVFGALKDRYQLYPELPFEAWDRCAEESQYKERL